MQIGEHMIQTHSKAQQGGFTLVEIAIVLVIIGLLLGGILKGQELITSARVRNMADQNSSVQAAYYGFLDRYRAIPGDLPAAQVCTFLGVGCPATGPGGNGNSLILDATGVTAEAAAVWLHLARAGFLNGSYAGTGALAAPTVAPGNVYGQALVLSHSASYSGAGATNRLNLALGRQAPVKVYQELDTKLDDGLPLTGVLRAALATGAIYNPVAEGLTTCVATGAWDIANDAQDCNGVFLY
ncbi:MAG: prepilin-type N-terminal cleavage/methylation domain-containing protein [Gammaproteobacteria bacterium]